MDLSSYISSGKHRTFSKHSATKPELPFLWSLKLASLSTGLPELRVNIGLQTKGLGVRSPSTSLKVPVEALFFCWPLLVRASLGPFPLLVYGINERCVRHSRSGWSGTTTTAGEEPLVWAVSRASRSGVFSLKPIPSGMLVSYWLELIWAGHSGRCEVLRASSRSS